MPLSSIEDQKPILYITNNSKATDKDKIRSRHHIVVDSSSSYEKTNMEIETKNNDDNKSATKNTIINSKKKQKIKLIIIGMVILTLIVIRFKHYSTNEKSSMNIRTYLTKFFDWMEEHTILGVVAFIVLYAFAVPFVLPGTPLIFGSGLVFCEMYSSRMFGMLIALMAVLFGATLGSIIAFSLGRYLLRDWVHRTFYSKYRIMDALNTAMTSNNGFRIMCLLHLTIVIPFGPISYICGTTNMSIITFALSNVAIIPLAIFYIFIGASMNHFILSLNEAIQGKGQDAELYHMAFMIGGIIISIASISYISHIVKKELDKILEKNRKITLQEEDAVDSLNPLLHADDNVQ